MAKQRPNQSDRVEAAPELPPCGRPPRVGDDAFLWLPAESEYRLRPEPCKLIRPSHVADGWNVTVFGFGYVKAVPSVRFCDTPHALRLTRGLPEDMNEDGTYSVSPPGEADETRAAEEAADESLSAV